MELGVTKKLENARKNKRIMCNTIYTDGKIAVIRLRKPKFEAPEPKDVTPFTPLHIQNAPFGGSYE